MILIVNGINTAKGGSGAHLLDTWLRSLDSHGRAHRTLDTIPALGGVRSGVLRALLLALYFLPGTLLRVLRLPLFELTYKFSPFLAWKFVTAVRRLRPGHVLFSHHAIFWLSLFLARERSHFIVHDLLYRRSRSLGFGRRISKFVFVVERRLYRRAASLLCLSYQEHRILRRFGFGRCSLVSCYAGEVEIRPPVQYDARRFAVVSDWRRHENTHGIRTFFQRSASESPAAAGAPLHCSVYGFQSEALGEMLARIPGLAATAQVDIRGSYKDHGAIPEGVFLIPIYQGAGIKIKLLEALRHRRFVFGTRGAFEGMPRRWLAGVTQIANSTADIAGASLQVDARAFDEFEQTYNSHFLALGAVDLDVGDRETAQPA